MELLAQIMIPLLSCTGVLLISCRNAKVRRWAYITGIVSQPFWMYTTLMHAQWGIFMMTFWYTFNWVRGIYNFWLFPKKSLKDRVLEDAGGSMNLLDRERVCDLA